MIPTRHLSLWAVGLSLLLSACASAYLPWRSGHGPGVATIAQTFSDAGLKRLTADMDPAMLALARRHDPVRRADLWGRPLGWASLNVDAPPDLGFGTTKLEGSGKSAMIRSKTSLWVSSHWPASALMTVTRGLDRACPLHSYRQPCNALYLP